MPSVRIWDLPTRLFHWVLALAVVLLVISAKVGGDAMHLHMRLGYLVFALLLFRLVWGVLGGHWSRFARFVPTPARLRAYLRGSPEASLHAGHNPLGALSVLAMLAVLSLQVASGLFADDEIAYSGPLTARASHALIKLATRWHTGPGQALVLALVSLHVAAIVWYWRRGQNLVRPMLSGDKSLTQAVPASRDGAGTRAAAVLVLAAAAAVVYAVVQWGARASLG